MPPPTLDRKSTRLNSSHTVIYTLSLHDALPIYVIRWVVSGPNQALLIRLIGILSNIEKPLGYAAAHPRSEEHTSELQSHSDLHSFPTRRSSDLCHPLGRKWPESSPADTFDWDFE